MKKSITITIMALLVLIILIVINTIIYSHDVYEQDYFAQIGISGKSYDSIILQKGNPSNTETKNGLFYAYYDGITLVFNGKKTLYLSGAIVTNGQYKFGSKNIGIGSEKSSVEKVYRHKTKIKNLPEGILGYIDGDTWVRFNIGSDNKVAKISISFDM